MKALTKKGREKYFFHILVLKLLPIKRNRIPSNKNATKNSKERDSRMFRRKILNTNFTRRIGKVRILFPSESENSREREREDRAALSDSIINMYSPL